MAGGLGRGARLVALLMTSLVAPVALVAGCDDDSTDPGPRSGVEAAEDLGRLPTVTRTVALPRLPSPEALAGAPTEYDRGWLFHDERFRCGSDQRSTSCGAILEVWESSGEARRRWEYLRAMTGALTVESDLEWLFLEGQLLLRVNGGASEAVADEYEAALRG